MLLLAVVAIFRRNVVLRDFLRLDFTLIGVGSVLDTAYGLGFERLTFFEELFDALRVDIFDTRESLNIAGLAGLVCKAL
jgi:Na+-translocating ferredoxin:NAD+ oxidoreductase RnfA subunit